MKNFTIRETAAPVPFIVTDYAGTSLAAFSTRSEAENHVDKLNAQIERKTLIEWANLHANQLGEWAARMGNLGDADESERYKADEKHLRDFLNSLK